MGDMTNAEILVRKPKVGRPLRKPRRAQLIPNNTTRHNTTPSEATGPYFNRNQKTAP
jgi:hypothetical protein